MKSIKIFERKVPMLAVIMAVLIIGLASAALVTSFMEHNTTVNVTAPLALNGDTATVNLVAGDCDEFVVISINNSANVPTVTEIVTEYDPDGEGIDVHYTYNGDTLCDVDGDGYPEFVVPAGSTGEELRMHICTDSALDATVTYKITTNFTPANGVGMLVLEDKDSSWTPVRTNDITATLIFGTNETEFSYCLTGTVTNVTTDYTLIYYPDEPNRYVNWGGVAGAVIGNESSNGTGYIEMSGSTNLNMDLPHPNDANYDMTETDYREAPDFYCNGCGAKIWLITSASLDGGVLPINRWGQPYYLFETELIQYDDTDWTYTPPE